ncbi:MAG: DNA mismatch repair endonuclease MutL [Elusimicrobiaceae bacterium]|nr:DNA mismatch repair endonuclease MutL [Elusimicrobiaceae bacterium]
MNKIHVLDEKTAGQIAAGEVIERPAGVLKELLENAVDAGATVVHIDIEGGGRELIRINDNGCGMTPADLAASVLRHATSKINHFEDLNNLHTFGFRGEALYSVAAVSHLKMTSCVPEGEGSCLEVHGGQVMGQRPAPAIAGTTVEIRDLFYNVPARLKFLKSASYERACLLKVVEESALANLQVGYTVVSSGREVYQLPAQTGPVKEAVLARARDILGAEVGESLIHRSFKELGLEIFITPPDKLVATRDLQFMFVNRRPVESKTIQQAVYRAFQNVRSKDRHPAFIIYIEADPASFDVNIHPQKRDIRFADERHMFSTILQAVSETVFSSAQPVNFQPQADASDTPVATQKPLVPSVPVASADLFEKQPGEIVGIPAVSKSEESSPRSWALRETEDPVEYRAANAEFVASKPQTTSPKADAVSSAQAAAPAWWHGPYHYLGQLEKTYLIFENPDGLVLIDQHAAQERVLYEQYLDAFEARKVTVQELIFPIHVDVSASNAESLMSWADWLKKAGFELARFSARTILVNTIPSMLRFKEDDMKAFIVSLSQIVGDPAKSDDKLKQKMVALLACKKAIKAHDQISVAEAEGLLENMKKCKDGMHCPHGRPCVAVLSTKDIAKLFGR